MAVIKLVGPYARKAIGPHFATINPKSFFRVVEGLNPKHPFGGVVN